eukprot:TRINITY_DN36745_c0_g1_i1.p1 TRINITY_DN36745_c0_g1~~TRINITY_DN36745_c0_g1_i1.p1  ORF type:complete len:160 (-),score=57.42 TRINITY_DN36745_c0_g1_i1:237-656(-)
MAQGEDSNIEEQGEAGVAEVQVVKVPELGKQETSTVPVVSELVPQADANLAVEAEESRIGRALNETVDEGSGVEVKVDTAPVVPELVTQAPESVAKETIENLIEAVDSSAGIDMKRETFQSISYTGSSTLWLEKLLTIL